MSDWRPIETAPKDCLILGHAPSWELPVVLMWKHDETIVAAKKDDRRSWAGWATDYFGVPFDRDLEFAAPGGAPTHWAPIPPLPLRSDKVEHSNG